MSDIDQFEQETRKQAAAMARDPQMQQASQAWMANSICNRYSYNFRWMGLPIIQYPQDMIALQEIIWKTKPDVIVETGVARGGSLVLSASLLMLTTGNAKVIGVDIDIRPHNRSAIESHPLAPHIQLIQGSSIDPDIVAQVVTAIPKGARVMVQLDSNHTHSHVLEELRAYAPLVTPGCYCAVMDGVVEDLPPELISDRPWAKGDNPKTAVHAYLAEDDRFEIDQEYNDKLQLTVAPDGYLRRLK